MDATATLRKRLGQMLVEAGLLSEADAQQAAQDAAAAGRRLGEYVVERGLITAGEGPQKEEAKLRIRRVGR